MREGISQKLPILSKKGLSLPGYAAEAGGKFGAMFFVMRNTFAALSVAGTAFFCAGTINIVMWAGHGS